MFEISWHQRTALPLHHQRLVVLLFSPVFLVLILGLLPRNNCKQVLPKIPSGSESELLKVFNTLLGCLTASALREHHLVPGLPNKRDNAPRDLEGCPAASIQEKPIEFIFSNYHALRTVRGSHITVGVLLPRVCSSRSMRGDA